MPEFETAFFVHIRKNTRFAAERDRNNANIGLSRLGHDLDADALTIENWRIQASHQISAREYMVYWAEEGPFNLLRCMFPEAADQELKEMMKPAEEGCKYGPFMTPQELTIRNTGAPGVEQGICAIHLSMEEVAPMPMRVIPPYSPAAVFPNSLPDLLRTITGALNEWQACGNEADPDDGYGEGYVVASVVYVGGQAKDKLGGELGEHDIVQGLRAQQWW